MAEFKSLPGATKKVEGRTVTGIFSVFGNRDEYNDVVHPGAFAKTIMERGKRVFHLWQHDFSSPPIARIVALREVGRDELPAEVLMRAPEARGGCEVTREYLDTPRAAEVLESLKDGIPLEMSFAFDITKYDFEELPDAKYEWEQQRNIREVRLYETSDVLWGANSATVASKSALALPLPFLLAQLKTSLANVPTTKGGARHSTEDIRMINDLHTLVVDLGCTACKGVADVAQTDTIDPLKALLTELEQRSATSPFAVDPNILSRFKTLLTAMEPPVVSDIVADVSRAAEQSTLTPAARYHHRRQAADRALVLFQRSLTS